MVRGLLEVCIYSKTEPPPFAHPREIGITVGDPLIIYQTQYLEYVFQSYSDLHVRHLVELSGTFRYGKQSVSASRVVLVGQGAIYSVEAYDFAEIQPLDKRYIVEYHTFHMPCKVDLSRPVTYEFEGVQHMERLSSV